MKTLGQDLEFADDMTSNTTPDILTINPYESHPSLSPLEASALWEYAKLAYNVQMVGWRLNLVPASRSIQFARRSHKRRVFSTKNQIK